jgi:ubiquinone/menaquinone biosynthesis C-methylase UbiE
MTDVKASVERQFSEAAAHYRTSAVHAKGEDLNRMVQVAKLSGTERVLDAGCGAGHTALAFAPRVAQVVAYDLSPAMLEQVEALATERGVRNVVLWQGDVENLPFDDNTFDRVVSRYSAHHWPHPAAALREFHRVVKPGGQFILSDIVASEAPALDTFLQAIELLRDPSHVRDHSIDQWLAMLEHAGFEAEVAFTWTLPLNFNDWVARIGTPALYIEALKALFDGAPSEVREAMDIQADYTFAIPGALLVAHKPTV